MMIESCIFCSIISGKTESDILAENDDCIAIVPLKMASRGHQLLIPKTHHETIFDIPETVLSSLMSFSQQISKSIRAQTNSTGINFLHASGSSAQQSVKHFHIHLLPRFDGDGLDTWPQLPGSSEKLDVCYDIT